MPIRCRGAATSFIAKRYRRWYAKIDNLLFISAQDLGILKFFIASSLAGGIAVDPRAPSNQCPRNLNEVTKGENLFAPIRNPALFVAQNKNSINRPCNATWPGTVLSLYRHKSSIYIKIASRISYQGQRSVPGFHPLKVKNSSIAF